MKYGSVKERSSWDFVDANINNWGFTDFDDVMTGVDHLIAQGLVDPDRMVKMGWSGGGHMTNKVITFTDRFKAASSGAGGWARSCSAIHLFRASNAGGAT